MPRGKQRNHPHSEGNPWSKCDLTHDEWEDVLSQVNTDIVAQENIIGLEGLAKHGQLWEDWFDAYLEGPIRARYWCTNKRDQVHFAKHIATIRQVFRTAVVTVARKERLKLAHSTGVLTSSSSAPTVPVRSVEDYLKVRKAIWRLNEKKRLYADSTQRMESESMDNLQDASIEASAADTGSDGLPFGETSRTSEGSIDADLFTPPAISTLTKKRGRSISREKYSNLEPPADRENGIMEDIECSNESSHWPTIDGGDWDKASAAIFSWPPRGLSLAELSEYPAASAEEMRFAAMVGVDSTLSQEQPPAKRQKAYPEISISPSIDNPTAAERATEETTSTSPREIITSCLVPVPMIEQTSDSKSNDRSSEQPLPPPVPPFSDLKGTPIRTPEKGFDGSKRDADAERNQGPKQLSCGHQELGTIALVLGVASDDIIQANNTVTSQPGAQPEITHRTNSVPATIYTPVSQQTYSEINDSPQQQPAMISILTEGISAVVTRVLGVSEKDKALINIPAEDPTEGVGLISNNIEIDISTQVLSEKNDLNAVGVIEEPHIYTRSDGEYLIIETSIPQAPDVQLSAIHARGTISKRLPTSVYAPGPTFTFATAIFEPKGGTKSNYILYYPAQAPTLDEFIIMLYENHKLDRNMGIMKLRVYIMGDCVEIGVMAEHRNWDWNTVMGIVEERRCKVSVLFEVVGDCHGGDIE